MLGGAGGPLGEERVATDEELIAASQRDPYAFEPLVARHSAGIHAYLRRRTASGVADDLLADVWLAAFSARSTYDPTLGSVRGWLFGVARHSLLAHYRRAMRRPVADPAGALAGVVDEWDAVDARLDAAAAAAQLRGGLAALPHVERELLLLVAWEQLTPAEAARVLDIPAGTARSRLHRARQRMCEHLQPPPQVPGETAMRACGDDE